MKMIQFSAGNSGSGKTITTSVICRILKNRGFDVRAFKCGPDYIDSEYLAKAAKSQKSNLDIHLMGRDGIKKSVSLNYGEIGIVEGAMGYFDGKGISYESSAYDIAKTLDINTVLIYRQGGEMFSIIPKLKGMIDFSDGRIKGIIFSSSNEKMYQRLKKMVEENLDIKVFGYIEKDAALDIDSEKLGLKTPDHIDYFDETLDRVSKRAEETLDIDGIMEIMSDVSVLKEPEVERERLKIAIARDDAFWFYYGENDRIFKKYFDVEYFSPMRDSSIPDADILFFGGGYPENFLYELSKNDSMKNSIRKFHEDGGIIYSEAGGTVYLSNRFENYEMCGVLDADCSMNDRLVNFGYNYIILKEDCLLGKKGDIIPAHQYHYYKINSNEKMIFDVEKADKSKSWSDGYIKGNALFSFEQINFCGNENVVENIINFVKEKKCI